MGVVAACADRGEFGRECRECANSGGVHGRRSVLCVWGKGVGRGSHKESWREGLGGEYACVSGVVSRDNVRFAIRVKGALLVGGA